MTTLIISAAGDQYEGDPQFTVDVNGVQVGGPYSVSALYSSGTFQQFTLSGNFGISVGSTVSVNYINDASGAGGDRNLYVGSVSVDGTVYQGSVAAQGTNGVLANAGALWADGTLNFTVAPTNTSTGQLSLVGINFSGQEQLTLPDTYPTDAQIQYYASKGLNVFRLPIAWERLQPTLGGAFSSSELAQIQRVVSYANSLGVTVDLDLHNYGQYNNQPIGSSAVPVSDFTSFWSQMAGVFSGSKVMFGLMNEPSLNASTWLTAQNAAIAAIRSAGATSQTILVSGVDYDGAATWLTSGNAATYNPSTIVDPDHNYAFEVHQYFDSNSSGVGGDTVSTTIGQQDLAAVTQWAQQNGAKLFLGEFGSNSDSTALANLKNTLGYMAANSNAWMGATEWEASTSYNYYFNVAPVNGVDSAQLTTLDQFAPGTAPAQATAPAPVAPVATPAPAPSAPAASNTSAPSSSGSASATGSGPDTLALTMSERAENSGAQFTMSVDGQQVGGVYTTTANSLAGQTQTFTAQGSFGTGNHTVSVDYLNASNSLLFVNGATLDGAMVPGSGLVLSNNGSMSFSFNGSNGSAGNAALIGSGPDSLDLSASERAEPGGAQFTVSVDGKQVGGVQTVTASSLTGQQQQFDMVGTFAPGNHSVSIDYLNANNSLLFINGATINGNTISGGSLVESNNGAFGFNFTTPAAANLPTIGSGPDTLALNVSEDYYLGNAQFTVSIDGQQIGGVQTANAIAGNGQSQALDVLGSFGGAHTVSVDFLNDAATSTPGPGTDRNLYVGSATIDGANIANSSLALYNTGAKSFSFTH